MEVGAASAQNTRCPVVPSAGFSPIFGIFATPTGSKRDGKVGWSFIDFQWLLLTKIQFKSGFFMLFLHSMLFRSDRQLAFVLVFYLSILLSIEIFK